MLHRPSKRSRILRRSIATSALTRGLGFGVLIGLASAAQAQQALPTGGAVISGTATIGGDATSVTVTQDTARAVVTWNDFSVGAGNSVTFFQPDADSATLNRVTGTAVSTIAGQISANGAVYLVNPNGIVITTTGTVQTGGGFVASTLNTLDSDFMNVSSQTAFTGTGASARVSNAGSITASGFAALLGGTVSNSGTISVPAGRIALGSGEAITLDINGSNFLQVAMPTAAVTSGSTALIENAGSITGNRIELSAATATDAVRNVVNMGGTLNADTATAIRGTILLSATGGGVVTASGTLTARATGMASNGGTITLAGGTLVTTGLSVDTQAAAIGAATGTLTLRQASAYTPTAALSGLLATTNVTIATTAGAITIANAINWSTPTTLTLASAGDIALNAAITAGDAKSGLTLSTAGGTAYTGTVRDTAALKVGIFNLTNGNWIQNGATLGTPLPEFSAVDFRFAPAAANFLRVTGGDGSAATPYRISDVYGLQGMASGNTLNKTFQLENAIDAVGTALWNDHAGFVAIGTDGTGGIWDPSGFSSVGGTGFTGNFNGAGFVISGLTINRSIANQGLFGYISGASAIAAIGLTGVSISGSSFVGGLVGRQTNSGSTIASATVQGAVTGTSGYVGGLGGFLTGAVSDSTASVTVTNRSSSYVGGLIGYAQGTVSSSSASGTVAGGTASGVGGLIGYVTGAVSGSSASGTVTGTVSVGGLVGVTTKDVSNSSASGTVTGTSTVGGLIGDARSLVSAVTGSSASGTVTGSGATVGGLIGSASSSVSTSFATGRVIGTSNVGGLIGSTTVNFASVDQSYASGAVTATAATGPTYAGGLIGQTLGAAVVSRSYATGAVSANSLSASIGGLIGASRGTISNNYASGAIGATGAYRGGLVGYIVAGTVGDTNYWDVYSTGLTQSQGRGTSTAIGVTSQPGSTAYPSAYATASYATWTASDWIFFNGQTRPFGAWEAPVSGGKITSSHQLQLIGANGTTLAGNYTLGANINLAETGAVVAGTPASYAGMWAWTGFVSLGTTGADTVVAGVDRGYVWLGAVGGTPAGFGVIDAAGTTARVGFSGSLTGTGFTLSNLTINRPTAKYTGLFGALSGTVTGVTLAGGSVAGLNSVGSLVGLLYTGGSVAGSTSSVAVSGTSFLGGLVGNQYAGTSITGSRASGAVSGTGGDIGGLVGYSNAATISGSSSSGAVSGATYIGGLVGYSYRTTTTDSSSTSRVTATVDTANALIGVQNGGTATNSTGTGPVTNPGQASPVAAAADAALARQRSDQAASDTSIDLTGAQ